MCYCLTSVHTRHVEHTVCVCFVFVFPFVIWRLLISHIRTGHVSALDPVNVPAFSLFPTLLFNARGHPLRCLPPKAVFTLSRQVCVCVNMSRVKHSPGLPAASFVPRKTNTKSHELLETVGFLFSCRPGLHVCVCACSSKFVRSF